MTKTVPLHELQPGDVVSFPSLTVQATLTGEPPFAQFQNGLWASYVWMEGVGATATREVPEPVFDLTWKDALHAMATHGAACERFCNLGAHFRLLGSRFQWKTPGYGWKDFDLNYPPAFEDDKWRIVESSGNSDISGEPSDVSIQWTETRESGVPGYVFDYTERYDLTTKEAEWLLNHLAQDPKAQSDIGVWVETMKEKQNRC
jgi:hypothetical protein